MNNYITIQQIDEKIGFVNLAITLSNVNSKSREDMEVVCKDGNFNIENLTSNIQIHSDIVNKIDESNIGQKKEGEALITNIPNTPLLIFTADCVPIAIIDKKNKAIGLAHAGWRGTYDAIAKKTIEKMADNYNTNPKDLVCIIGPSIGPCCYEVSKDLVEKFEKKVYDILVLNTICNATQERQVEARRIASEVDAMIVIGGRHSSNTQKLYEICQKECKNTYFIQSLGDFNPECVNSVRSVGITAGASTPNQIIEEVHTNVRIKF